jgi:hypothetical protein
VYATTGAGVVVREPVAAGVAQDVRAGGCSSHRSPRHTLLRGLRQHGTLRDRGSAPRAY